MKYLTLTFAVMLGCRAFAVGDSEVGVFITPPAWATTNSTATVPKRYTPLGTTNDPVRLNVSAALGMCATLDGLAERMYVPNFNQADPWRGDVKYTWLDFDPGPINGWKSLNFSIFPWGLLDGRLWTLPAERQITNSWSRIFPRVSTMLEDVRGRLRQLALGQEQLLRSSLIRGTRLSSSLFGDVDTLSFDWCSRDQAITNLIDVADDLCLDWSCTSDQRRPCLQILNAVDEILQLYDYERTNIYARLRADSPAPLPRVHDILMQLEPTYLISEGWLTNQWRQMRIDADDFGWMNKMIAAIDKSYMMDYDGLPLIQFAENECYASASRTMNITGGVFLLSYDQVAGNVASVENVLAVNPVDTTNSSPVTTRVEWNLLFSLNDLGANAEASIASAAYQLMIDPVTLATQTLDPPVSPNGIRQIIFNSFTDDENGPTIEILAAPNDGTSPVERWQTVDRFRTLNIVSTLPVSHGTATCTAQGDISWTARILPYGTIGTNWPTNYSGRHVRPLPDSYVSNYVSTVNYQLAAKRTIKTGSDDEGTVEYYAEGAGTNSQNLDRSAFSMAATVFSLCRDKASDAIDFDFENPTGNIHDWLGRNATALFDAAVNNASENASWSVGTVGAAYLIQTNGTYSIFQGVDTTNGMEFVELPTFTDDGTKYSIYGSISAWASGSAATNAPTISLSCEMNSSAAVYWTFHNIPDDRTAHTPLTGQPPRTGTLASQTTRPGASSSPARSSGPPTPYGQ